MGGPWPTHDVVMCQLGRLDLGGVLVLLREGVAGLDAEVVAQRLDRRDGGEDADGNGGGGNGGFEERFHNALSFQDLERTC